MKLVRVSQMSEIFPEVSIIIIIINKNGFRILLQTSDRLKVFQLLKISYSRIAQLKFCVNHRFFIVFSS
jgi:hypothetical protein